MRGCVARPDCGVPLDDLRRLMPHVALVNPKSIYFCWYALTNGLLEYRAGRMPEAIELLSTVQTDRFDTALSAAAAGLAMAHCRLGDNDRARAHLKHARALIDPLWPNEAPAPDAWHEMLLAYLLVQEAEELIESAR